MKQPTRPPPRTRLSWEGRSTRYRPPQQQQQPPAKERVEDRGEMAIVETLKRRLDRCKVRAVKATGDARSVNARMQPGPHSRRGALSRQRHEAASERPSVLPPAAMMPSERGHRHAPPGLEIVHPTIE